MECTDAECPEERVIPLDDRTAALQWQEGFQGDFVPGTPRREPWEQSDAHVELARQHHAVPKQKPPAPLAGAFCSQKTDHTELPAGRCALATSAPHAGTPPCHSRAIPGAVFQAMKNASDRWHAGAAARIIPVKAGEE